MATNSKDVVIRFTGQNLVGPAIQGLQKQLNDLAVNSRKQSMVTLKGTVGDALNAEIKMKADARFKLIRDSEERALKLRQFYARQEEQLEAARGAFGRRLMGAGKKAFGTAGLAAGMVGDAFGDTGIGRAAGGIASIGGQAAMGGMVAGPWGAAIFGGIEALKQFKGELERTTKIVTKAREFQQEQVTNFIKRRGDVISDARAIRQAQFPDLVTEDDARRQLVERARQAKELLFLAKDRKGGFDAKDEARFRAEWNQILGERVRFDEQRRFRDSGVQGLTALFQSRAGLFGAAQRMGGGLLDQGRAAFNQWRTAGFEAQRQQAAGIIEGGKTPAERLREEMKELESLRARGAITPDQAAKARRRLLMQGISGLQDKPFHHLAAVESRSLTRGVDQKPQDELKTLLHQDSENEQKLLRELIELEKSKRRLDVVLR
jgi:hypothetical protein